MAATAATMRVTSGTGCRPAAGALLVAGVVVAGARSPLLALVLWAVLDLLVVAALRADTVARVTRERTVGPGRYLLLSFAGSLVVGLLVVTALAATTAGDAAVPHGEHGLPSWASLGSHAGH